MLRLLIILCVTIEVASATNVRDFGATGDGQTDDTVPIQRAINATAGGDTLAFPAGTYRITSTLLLKPGITCQGENNPVLNGYQGTGPNGYALASGEGASNITIRGITFDGGGLMFAQDEWTQNVVVSANVFRNITSQGPGDGRAQSGVFIDHVSNVFITGNQFSNIIDGGAPTTFTEQGPLANGIRVYHATNIMIVNNSMDFWSREIPVFQRAILNRGAGPFSDRGHWQSRSPVET